MTWKLEQSNVDQENGEPGGKVKLNLWGRSEAVRAERMLLSLIPDWKGTARCGGVGRARVTSRIRRGRAPQSLMLVFYQD